MIYIPFTLNFIVKMALIGLSTQECMKRIMVRKLYFIVNSGFIAYPVRRMENMVYPHKKSHLIIGKAYALPILAPSAFQAFAHLLIDVRNRGVIEIAAYNHALARVRINIGT